LTCYICIPSITAANGGEPGAREKAAGFFYGSPSDSPEAEQAEILRMLLEICLPLNVNQLCAVALVLAWLVRWMRQREDRGETGRSDGAASFELCRRGYRLSEARC
jgi:hypothetical protein